jgi:hypothetical protein
MEDEVKLLEKIQGLIDKSQEGVASKKDIEKEVSALNKSIEKLTDEGKASLKESVDAMVLKQSEMNENLIKTAAELKALKDGVNEQKSAPKSFRDIMEAAIMEKKDSVLTEINDTYGKRFSLKEFFEKNGSKAQMPTFTLKAAVDMLESEIVQSNVSSLRLTDLDPNRVSIPLTIYPHVINVMPKKQISKPNMALLVVYTYWDGSGTKPEGTASGKSSFLFKTVSFPAFYIATYFTLSDETLDDLQEALDEINLVAPDAINDKIDSKILSTAGDDSSDIKGLFAAAKSTAFVPGTYPNFVKGATLIDLIACMKLSVEASKYMPDTVWMNPTDIAKLAALKNDISDSVSDRRIVFGAFGEPVAVLGLTIRKNTNVTADTMAVGKMGTLMLGIRKDMTMEIGYNGTDLTEGQKTVVIKTRVAFGVRDAKATVYSATVAADIVSINEV